MRSACMRSTSVSPTLPASPVSSNRTNPPRVRGLDVVGGTGRPAWLGARRFPRALHPSIPPLPPPNAPYARRKCNASTNVIDSPHERSAASPRDPHRSLALQSDLFGQPPFQPLPPAPSVIYPPAGSCARAAQRTPPLSPPPPPPGAPLVRCAMSSSLCPHFPPHPFLLLLPPRFAPLRFAPLRTAPHRTAPHRSASLQTAS